MSTSSLKPLPWEVVSVTPILDAELIFVNSFLTNGALLKWCLVTSETMQIVPELFLSLAFWRPLWGDTLSERSHHALRNPYHMERSRVGVSVNRPSPDPECEWGSHLGKKSSSLRCWRSQSSLRIPRWGSKHCGARNICPLCALS